MTKDYKLIYKKYRLICNNSVNGGDCYSETYCKEDGCQHKPDQYRCAVCNMTICSHCYQDCPSCPKPFCFFLL